MTALFTFPELNVSNYPVDDVAMKLYPDKAPRDFVPLDVYGDGNCLFRAVSLVATGDEQNHGQFRKLVMKELRDNAEYYADLFFPQAENQQATEVSISILSQTLCDAPSRIFSECLASNMELRNAYIAAVRHAATVGEKSRVWSGMLEMAGLASVLKRSVHSIYPRQFMQWSNILALVELLFCLPMSNGRVESTFSQMKLIKTDRRCNLGEASLDSLLRIEMEGPEFLAWDSSRAVQLWWTDACRRQVQETREAPNSSLQESGDEELAAAFDLDDWESLLL